MQKCIQIDLSDFSSSVARPQVFLSLSHLTEKLGFIYWSYTLVSYNTFEQPKRSLLSNLPVPWQEAYLNNGYAATDPAISLALRSSQAFVWNEALFEKAVKMWVDAHQHGLSVGWTQSSRVQGSSSVGILSLFRNLDDITPAEIGEKQVLFHWVAHQLHQKMLNLQKLRIKLTPTEESIMRLAADGKTTTEIASALSLKERSVNFRIARVLIKLGVQNKTAAAAQLATEGYLV
jgi:LuxR family transcriptional regulator, quorum-sensing system regulator SolR